MAKNAHPTYANGKICYIEIPSADIPTSVAFFQSVFDWQPRLRGDGVTAFDDGAGEVSGAWVTGRPPMTSVGLLIYIMVEDIEAALVLVKKHGGTVVQPVGMDAPELTARFSDPYGNIWGLYQEPVIAG